MRIFLVLLALLTLSPFTAHAQTCGFVLGFAALHNALPEVVGDCVENIHFDSQTGDGLQATTNGLLVWNKAENLTSFTDGSQTWINGPLGIQTRLNTQRFEWEPNPDHLEIVPPREPGERCSTAGTTLSVVGSDAGAGNLVATFALTNTLNVPCQFFGYIGAELRDANDNALPTVVVRGGGPFASDLGPTLVSVPPDGFGEVLVHWTQVPSGNETTCPVASGLAITLPDEYVPQTVPITIRACSGGRLDVSAVRSP
jgi:Protein of unknown function (DUF4232)